MAQNLMLPVNPNFNLPAFVQQLSDTYRSKGYTTNIMDMGGNFSIVIEKDTTGIQNLLGLSEHICVNCIFNGNTLNLNYTDEQWTGKIIALAVGWFVCCVPFITGIIGCVRQYSLPTNINNDAKMIAASQNV